MSIINNQNTDKFKVVISNIPVPSTRTTNVDMAVFNNYVRSVTLPDYNVEVVPIDFRSASIKTPASRLNNDLAPVTLDFICDEDVENYISFFEWMLEIRAGNPTKGETTTRESTIKNLTVLINDNQDRPAVKFVIKDLLLVSLSSLSMIYGASEQSLYTASFQYNTIDIERIDTERNN